MLPPETRLARISACRFDLALNGLDPDSLSRRRLRELARTNLEYFQSMLGYDARPGEIVRLMEQSRPGVTRSPCG